MTQSSLLHSDAPEAMSSSEPVIYSRLCLRFPTQFMGSPRLWADTQRVLLRANTSFRVGDDRSSVLRNQSQALEQLEFQNIAW